MTSGSGSPPLWCYWVVLPATVLIWAVLAATLETDLLPTPSAVNGELWRHLAATLARVAIAFGVAMLLGVVIGSAMGRSARLNALFDPLLVILLNLPALVTIILMYVWFGLVEMAALLAVIINKVPNVAVTVREGSRSLDDKLEQMAVAYRFNRWQWLREVWLPQMFPYLMAATRGGLALIWKIVLVVELLGRSNGVGFKLHLAFQVFDVATILAYSLAFIAVVQVIELAILQPLERRANRWRRPEMAHA